MGLGTNLNGILEKIGRPLPTFTETWQAAVPDPAVWDVTDPATGSAWARSVVGGSGGNIYMMAAPNASENARLKSKVKFGLSFPDSGFIRRKLILEFEAKLLNPLAPFDPTHIDGVNTWLGLSDAVGGGSIGFTVSAGALLVTSVVNQPVSSAALHSGLQVLYLQNKYRVEISMQNAQIVNEFFVNDVRVARLIGADAQSMADGMIDLDVATLPAGAARVFIGGVRLWYKDVP